MENQEKCECGCGCRCDLSKINLDMTLRDCLKSMGIDENKAQDFLKKCCQDCCPKN